MTIDLGFAYWPVEGAPTIGFVDVPGHERFVRNMLCGVAGIDQALLIVAADDGPMPQTREHLAILDLLGVTDGAVAITKIDRVEAERVGEVEFETRALLEDSSLAKAEFFQVSSVTGAGVDALRVHLEDMAKTWTPRAPLGNFRLAVDRRFNLVGQGLVVTGTVHSGTISVNDAARALLADRPARVRSIHAQNAKSEIGRAGQRCALNLVGPGIDLASIDRGEWIVAGEVPPPARKIDVRLRILPGEARALSHWTPVHVHLGAAEVTGRVALLGMQSVRPGESGLAQLVLDRPIGALRGDGFVIRDQSAQRTIGGGRVVDVYPPPRGRAKPERLVYLKHMEGGDDRAALAALLEVSPRGLHLARFATNRNLTKAESEALFSSVAMTTVGALGFSPAHWDALKRSALDALAAWHKRAPDAVGPAEDRVLSDVAREVSTAVVAELIRGNQVVKEGAGVRLATHKASLAPADAVVWAKVTAQLDQAGLRPPSLHEIATAIGESPKTLEAVLVRIARLGLLVRLSENRFYRPAELRQLAAMAEEIAATSDTRMVTAAAFRDRSALGRNLAIEVLEYFDRIKVTRRVGDAHQLLRPAPAGPSERAGINS
jgi:selenocysteine-specific elongation factor